MSTLRFLRVFLPVTLAALAACSSTPPAPKPKPYPALSVDRVWLQRIWKVSVGKGLGGDDVQLAPVVGEQYVMVASRNGELLCLDRGTGKAAWRVKTGLPLTAGPGAGYGLVAVGTAKGEVAAFAQDTGAQKWKVSVGAPVMAAPAVSADVVVVLAADGVVHGLSRETGEQRWTYGSVVPPLSLHANAAPLIAGNAVYVATAGGKLLNLELATGIADWEVRVATNNGRSELERMTDIVGDMLLSGDRYLYTVGYQSQLTVTDVEAGRRGWQFDVSSVNGLAEGIGNVYVSDTDGVLFGVDQASGRAVWKQPVFEYRALTAPVVFGNLLAVGDNEGFVHLMAQSDGSVRGRIHPVRDALVSLVSRDDTLYVWSAGGKLSAWKLQ